ncbi:unnamed protein product [Phaeothamnion confervicola]
MGQVIAMCASDDAEGGYISRQPERYRVIGKSGATIRASQQLDSAILCTLSTGTIIEVAEVKGRRCRVTEPVKGWGSLATESGYLICELVVPRQRYRVVYPDGVIVRTAADIDTSEYVSTLACGEVVEGTGVTEDCGGVERVQIADGGWVSMHLREEDARLGEPLLERL